MAAKGPYRIAIYKGAVTATCSWRGLQPQRKPPWRRLPRIASESASELAPEQQAKQKKKALQEHPRQSDHSRENKTSF
ncbi:hypothetical protein QG37_08272 [Candidozyma auris]|uniref:Uncharacterized protein n=1 Tax=Candidozyma auris TaxID=498019 RepID=A0A0L0NPA6_CANAR|nr:hypothetical protein QG37_08272 [[Candida] auris]